MLTSTVLARFASFSFHNPLKYAKFRNSCFSQSEKGNPKFLHLFQEKYNGGT